LWYVIFLLALLLFSVAFLCVVVVFLQDNADGSYNNNFNATVVGTYVMNVTLEGLPVGAGNGQWTFTVIPGMFWFSVLFPRFEISHLTQSPSIAGPVNALRSRLTGASTIVAGGGTTLRLVPSDAFGNLISDPGMAISVTSQPTGIFSQLTYNVTDGSWNVFLNTTVAGSYQISVNLPSGPANGAAYALVRTC
jgi:hypothetical protein